MPQFPRKGLMPRLRFVSVDLEDANDESMRSVLQTLRANVVGVVPPSFTEVVQEPALPPATDPKRSVRSLPAPNAAAAPATAVNGSSSIGDLIRHALAKRPMSSMELAEALKLDVAKVYSPVSLMKKQGVLENVMDESDGTRRYQLK